MSWAALSLDGRRLYGIDASAFSSLQSATVTQTEKTDEGRRFIAAAGKVRVLLQGPKYCGQFAATFGLDAFFDSIAVNVQLAGDLQQLLAHSYAWFRYTHDSRSPGDIDEVRADRQFECMRELLAAFSVSAPVVIGASSTPAGRPVLRAIGTAMDTRGETSF